MKKAGCCYWFSSDFLCRLRWRRVFKCHLSKVNVQAVWSSTELMSGACLQTSDSKEHLVFSIIVQVGFEFLLLSFYRNYKGRLSISRGFFISKIIIWSFIRRLCMSCYGRCEIVVNFGGAKLWLAVVYPLLELTLLLKCSLFSISLRKENKRFF